MSRRKEIEQAAMQVGGVHPDWDVLECFRVGFKEGAKWADKTMIDKAVKWLTNNWREYVYQDGDGIVHFGHFESDFRKAMEE